MNSPGLSKQIIILAIFPALFVGIMLSVYFTYDQLSFISSAQTKYGNFIIKQIEPAVEHSLVDNDMAMLQSLLRNIAANENINYISISGTDGKDIVTINNVKDNEHENHSYIFSLLENKNRIAFKAPVYHNYQFPDGTTFREVVANIELKLNTHQATRDKIEHILRGGSITIAILFLFTLIIFGVSKKIISPIKSLTESVRNITAGDLDSHIGLESTGELGILESCINHMKNELKDSRVDMETQLNTYTEELQQTLEELEIRNAELDITRSKAIYANNAKSEILANMSHEIRTPLSGIIGFTELLQDTKLSAQQKDYSSTIHKSSKHLLSIINDVLDLSKIEAGKTEITTSQFNLVDIIEDIINLLSTSALEKNIELLYRIEKDVPTIIHADPFRIHQILTNLIGNSIKFTDSGYVYLQVTRGEIKDAENSIKFTVSDTGLGMSRTVKKRLFKAFTQADTSITRRFGGTGLGLVISRKLTILMHGEIGFDSTEGEGSTFWFSVPVKIVDSEIIQSELGGKNIALIGSHFIAKQAYKTLFSNWGCKINDYSLDDIDTLSDIENNNDIIITFLSRKEITSSIAAQAIDGITLSKPSLLIASTRSYSELRSLQQHHFDNAVFTSEKIEVIKHKLINSLNKNVLEDENLDFDDATLNSNDWSNINILVVDDNDVNLRLAEIILHKHKARVTTAHSGTQAVDCASLNSYDIIFMDLHMPGLDGYETTQKIREITPGNQSVIIALTANAMPQEKEKVISSGMNGILIKPVSDTIFQKVINQWVLKAPINTANIGAFDNEISQENSKQLVFSIERAKEFTGNNEELAYELFGMLRAELNDYKKAIMKAVDNNDLTELRNQVHKLHGASRCCGTTELKEVSNRIENFLIQGIKFDSEEEIPLLLNAIQNVADIKIDDPQLASSTS